MGKEVHLHTYVRNPFVLSTHVIPPTMKIITPSSKDANKKYIPFLKVDVLVKWKTEFSQDFICLNSLLHQEIK